MKKILTLFVIVLIAVFSASKAEARTFSVNNMTGTIGKYKVVMSLTFNDSDNSVTGWYYYKSKGPNNKIKLSGTYVDKSYNIYSYHILMNEKVNGKVTGSFDVEYIQGASGNIVYTDVIGDFTTAAGKRYDVSVSRSN